MKIVKIVPTEFKNESRDERELSVCRQLGAEIAVFAKGPGKKVAMVEQVDSFTVHRCSTRPLGRIAFNPINRIISLFTWAYDIKKEHPDIISGHDLVGLAIGWISTWFIVNKPLLVYDSHEFELGRNAQRTRLQKILIRCLEQFLIGKSALVIMVNDSIADEVQKIYHLRCRPLVIRNMPPRWKGKIKEIECMAIREEIDRAIGKGFLLLYHGAISRGRGIENAIKILTYDNTYHLLVLGHAGEKSYQDALVRYAKSVGVYGRVLFHDAVPYDLLWKYVGAADVSVMLTSGEFKSYYFALPNKLFESIQAGVPVLASAFPEFKRIIDGYRVGLTCNPDNEIEVERSLKQILEPGSFQKYKKNTAQAASELCWEKEKRKLVRAYKRLLKKRKRRM